MTDWRVGSSPWSSPNSVDLNGLKKKKPVGVGVYLPGNGPAAPFWDGGGGSSSRGGTVDIAINYYNSAGQSAGNPDQFKAVDLLFAARAIDAASQGHYSDALDDITFGLATSFGPNVAAAGAERIGTHIGLVAGGAALSITVIGVAASFIDLFNGIVNGGGAAEYTGGYIKLANSADPRFNGTPGGFYNGAQPG